MRTPSRLGLYGAGLAVVFAAALGAGKLVGPPAAAGAGTAAGTGHGTDAGTGHGTDAGTGHGTGREDPADHLPGGLQVTEAGYRLMPETSALTPGTATDFRFRIIGPDGAPVTRYTPTHERDLHLIVVRRDLSGFQHVHPTRAGDGLWSVPLPVTGAGQYRVFADFQPAGRDAPLTLGVDLPAAGTYQPVPPAEPTRSAEVDGYRVDVEGHLVPGSASTLRLTVSRDGRAVTDLQPYLGASGHLVALREGDLAYLHVHPDGAGLMFTVEVPSAGRYGLFLDFKHGDAVHTATFMMAAQS